MKKELSPEAVEALLTMRAIGIALIVFSIFISITFFGLWI